MMLLATIVGGLTSGLFCALIFNLAVKWINARPLFTSMGRAMKALLSDEGGFLREYAKLLGCVAVFLFWWLLAIIIAAAPIAAVWPFVEGYRLWLIVIFSLASMFGYFWLRQIEGQQQSGTPQGGLSVSDSQFFFYSWSRARLG